MPFAPRPTRSLLAAAACALACSEPATTPPPVEPSPEPAPPPPMRVPEVAITPEALGAVPRSELDLSCNTTRDVPEPEPRCGGDASLFTSLDAWHTPPAELPRSRYDWLAHDRIRFVPEGRLPEAIALLEHDPVVRLASADAAPGAPQPYLIRAVYPELPGPPGCRHLYSVRLEPRGAIAIVNPTLSRTGQCPVPMRRAAIVAYLDAPPTAVEVSAATLRQ